MKLYFRSALLILALLFCLPYEHYAAFPVKKTESLVAATSTNYRELANSQINRRTFAGNTLRKVFPHNLSFRPAFNKTEAVLLAIVSLLFGGLGLHRLYLGYTFAGLLQLSGVLFAIFGYDLALYGFYGGLAAMTGAGVFALGLVMLAFGAGLWLWQLSDLIRITTDDLPARDKNMPHRRRY